MSRKKLHHPDTTGKGLGNAGQQTELPGAGQYIGAGTNIRVNTGLQKGKEFWNPLRFIQNSAVRISIVRLGFCIWIFTRFPLSIGWLRSHKSCMA